MRPLGPRDGRRGRSNSSGEDRFHLNLQALAVQTQTGPSVVPSAPVSPEQRSRSHRQRMEQDAHLARFGRWAPTPLTLLPQQTRTAVANARPIDDPQTAIAFSTVLMRDQDVACWASQGPIGLERKVGSCEAASFPGRRGGGWCIPRGRRRGRRGGRRRGRAFRLWWEGRRKPRWAYPFRG